MNEPLIVTIMEQARSFAASHSMAGSGSAFEAYEHLEEAKTKREELRRMVLAVIQERDALRAEIEGMWKQEPALYVQSNHFVQCRYSPYLGRICQQPMQGIQRIHSVALYLAPGAQPAEVLKRGP